MPLKLTRDPLALALAALLVLCSAVLVGLGRVSWREAAGFLTGALALPGLLGRADKPRDDDGPGNPPAGGATPLIIGCIALAMSACGAPSTTPQSEAQKQTAAGAAYQVDLMSCVDKVAYPTRVSSDACVNGVHDRWNRNSDGGAR